MLEQYNGKPVLCINSLEAKNNICIFVFSFNPFTAHKLYDVAVDLGFETYMLDAVVLSQYSREVLNVFDLLSDEISRKTYVEIIESRMKGRYPKEGTWCSDAYFCWREFSAKGVGEVFIDCGSYVGDSIERYVWYKDGVFKKVYGFEPDEKNFSAMQYRMDRLSKEWNCEEQICLINARVGEKTQSLRFLHYRDGLGSIYSDKGDEEKNIYALDDYVQEDVDFIKADIESYEYEMLLGAKNIIRNNNPNLAICIYHNAVDLFSIALLIEEIDSRYKFAVRHHSNTLSETVLYAWVDS